MRQASGRLRNHRGAPYDTVRVVFELYDKRGNFMYSRTATILGVRAHEDRIFTTYALPGHPAAFRIASVAAEERWSSTNAPSPGRMIRGGKARSHI